MKIIYIIRHAKSSWARAELQDFDRPLNERGERDAPLMGRLLKENKVATDIIISSPAVRALTTAKIIGEWLGFDERKIITAAKLYHAEEETWLELLKDIDESCGHVMMFGHNPGLTEFVNLLLNEEISNVPTTGVVAARLHIEKWKDAQWGCGKLIFFECPRNAREA